MKKEVMHHLKHLSVTFDRLVQPFSLTKNLN